MELAGGAGNTPGNACGVLRRVRLPAHGGYVGGAPPPVACNPPPCVGSGCAEGIWLPVLNPGGSVPYNIVDGMPPPAEAA
jgi:hypothetical protein